MARFVMVPGFWLGAWAWEAVTERLQGAGHQVQALTLPGLESTGVDRSSIRLDDHVAAVVDALEEHPDAPAILVGHSGAGVVIYAATDRKPQLVRRGVYVDAMPLADGQAIGFPSKPEATEVPLPSWEAMAELDVSLDGLSPAQLDEFRARAVPEPVGPTADPVRLVDPRRRQVPVTLITCEFPAEAIRRHTAQGAPYFAELPHLDVTIVELPTGHYPMWSRTADLVDELLALEVS